ncbi:MAG: GGDEF domain-containing protein [Deltaproteobacteria bacterium]|nr:GGDEF domain-containing protein [Deltaproteobacteria bacterium]
MAKERETVITVVTKGLDERAAPAGQACMVVFYGQNLGKRYFLEHSEQIIGRSDSVNIQVEQDSVSRQHAKIVSKEGRWVLIDLDSTNGSFVNDQQVTQTDLRDGDMVRVGQTIFKYLSGSNIESKYHEEIYRLTTMDGLTQAFNKRYFIETIERELNRAIRYGRMLSLIMFDIDHFKKINDTHGHLAGDYVLRELAGIVSHSLRREDVFARYGGEEFAIILPEIDKEGAVHVAEKLRGAVADHVFSFANENIPVTISLGVRNTMGDEPKLDTTKFVADADAKLYEAKQTGRNRVCH